MKSFAVARIDRLNNQSATPFFLSSMVFLTLGLYLPLWFCYVLARSSFLDLLALPEGKAAV